MQEQEKRGNTPDFSIDDILAETKALRSVGREARPEKSGTKKWSAQEIDALLTPKKAIHVDDIISPALEQLAGDFPVPAPAQGEAQVKITQDAADRQEKKENRTPDKTPAAPPSPGIPKVPDIPEKTRMIRPDDGQSPTEQAQGTAKQADFFVAPPTRNIRPHQPEIPDDTETGGRKIETDLYRERFIRRPVQALEKTAEHERFLAAQKPVAVEKPGIIKRKSQFQATADLEPLPTIVPAEEELAGAGKTILAGGTGAAAQPVRPPADAEILRGQIKFSGFEEPVLEKIDEYQAEQALHAARKERVRQFKLFEGFRDFPSDEEEEEEEVQLPAPQETAADGEAPAPRAPRRRDATQKLMEEAPRHEYTDPKDAPGILEGLRKKTASLAVSCVVTGICTAILLYLTIAPQFMKGALPGGSPFLYLTITLVFLLIAAAAGFSPLRQGVREVFRSRANADTGVAAAMLLCAIQTGVLYRYPDQIGQGVFLFGAVAACALLLNLCGKLTIVSRIRRNFSFCAGEAARHSIQSIANPDDAFEIGRGLLMGEPDVKYSAAVRFPAHFLEASYKGDPADRLGARLTPPALLFSVLIGIAAAFFTKSVPLTLTALAGAVCISVPLTSLLASNLPLLRAARRLIPEGAMLAGHTAVRDCAKANAVVFDASDIFPRGCCNIHGIKTFHSMRIDEAILDAAAIVISAGGPCGEVFDRVIQGRRELLPEVESMAYEDKLGLSGWIHGRRVLVGSRDLLLHHSVEAPTREQESKYRHDGRQVMYLAVAGKIAAMFVVSYQASEDIALYLQNLECSGVTILVRTSDPNITEELIEEYFSLPHNVVKVISAVAGQIYKEYRDARQEEVDAGVLHDGSVRSMLRAMTASINLQADTKLCLILQMIGTGLGLGIIGVLACFSGLAQIGALQLLLYELFWGAVSVGVALHKKP